MAENNPLTGYEPNFFDEYHNSKITEMFFQVPSSDTRPSCLHDAEISDDTIGRPLSSPLFTQEREEPAGRRQGYHSLQESLLPSQSLSVCHVRTGRPVNELSSLGSSIRENPSRYSENEQIRILLERQNEQILADCKAEIQNNEFQADHDKTSIQKLNRTIESQRGEIYRAHQGDERLRQDHQLLHAGLFCSQRFLALSRSLTCDGSFGDEFHGVVSSKITLLSHPDTSKFRFRSFPRSPTIQLLYLSHPYLTCFTFCQNNQEIVNMYAIDPFQHTVIRVTTPQALLSRHGFPSKLRKFLCDV